MSNFTTVKRTDEEFGNQVQRKRVYRFTASLLFDKQSFGINGFDLLPRFLVRPKTLINLLDFESDGNSTTRGYIANDLFDGFFVKNTGLSDKRLLFEFNHMKTKSPFGFTGIRDYKLFANKVFDPAYQSQLNSYWHSLDKEVTVEDHEYLERTVEAKEVIMNYFEELDEFIEYDYLGNKSKGVTFS